MNHQLFDVDKPLPRAIRICGASYNGNLSDCDIICDGIDDDVEINFAIESGATDIQLSGIFYLSDGGYIDTGNNPTISIIGGCIHA